MAFSARVLTIGTWNTIGTSDMLIICLCEGIFKTLCISKPINNSYIFQEHHLTKTVNVTQYYGILKISKNNNIILSSINDCVSEICIHIVEIHSKFIPDYSKAHFIKYILFLLMDISLILT